MVAGATKLTDTPTAIVPSLAVVSVSCTPNSILPLLSMVVPISGFGVPMPALPFGPVPEGEFVCPLVSAYHASSWIWAVIVEVL
jgi:hypothetical protein